MDRAKTPDYAFFGATRFSKELLEFLIEKGFKPKAIFSIPEYFYISYSQKKVKNYNYANLEEISNKFDIPYFEVDSVPGKQLKDYERILQEMNLDLLLVLGWYYMMPKSVRDSARLGAWGIHASLLPKYAGGAPLVWAMIKGEKETGVTLFRMSDGVDDGDIILQKRFSIEFHETIADVYKKATEASKEIIIKSLENIEVVKFTPQQKDKIEIFPQRSPEDGEIDLGMSAEEMYNFIRAQSSPYPGAFIKTVDGKKLVIEKARIEDM